MDLTFYYVNNINILDYNSTESCNLKKSYLYYWTILPSITEELTHRRMSIIILVSLLATIQMLLQKSLLKYLNAMDTLL